MFLEAFFLSSNQQSNIKKSPTGDFLTRASSVEFLAVLSVNILNQINSYSQWIISLFSLVCLINRHLHGIAKTLRKTRPHVLGNHDYDPNFTRTDLTDDLIDVFDLPLDQEFISDLRLKQIISRTKKKKEKLAHKKHT